MPWPSSTAWCLVPGLPRSVGLGPIMAPLFCRNRGAVDRRSRPVDALGLGQFLQQQAVQRLPHPGLMPVAQAPPDPHPISRGSLAARHGTGAVADLCAWPIEGSGHTAA